MRKTATVQALTPQQAKIGALARRQERRKPPRYREYPDGFGNVSRIQVDTGGEVADPVSVGEWIDDSVAHCPLARPFDVLALMLEALRGGVAAVPEAVAIVAATGNRDVQFATWMNISSLPGGPAGVAELRSALAREWQRRGLPVMPGPPRHILHGFDRNSRPGGNLETYRTPWGQPAGLPLPA